MNESKRIEVESKANSQMMRFCQEAQLIQATGGKAGAPAWWWWAILAILGYNEFMAIISHPIFLLLGILVLGVISVGYVSNSMGVLVEIAKQASSMVLSVVIPLLTSLQQTNIQQRRADD